ncbi:Heavy metal transport/detoxification protein [Thermocrinis albus DSM 14484]|uniref:Heavy metal transport/detoxification protein n=1 Tax=Thermocrinis albus (strain DSM 14484 / JCM 11386 / HI 11/12) TaxID=638303 RepID=D3SPC1_THEAH|nr:heavy metal-associated domain-containing protein [Thermocrinis albus]ADC89008.1 Heavy metal transport/detoxification protein [Thermocrinis albus DSM 14484]
MREIRLKVEGMTCQHCVQRVRTALLQVEGVSWVDVNLEEGTVTVKVEDNVPLESLREAIESYNYRVAGEV